VAFTGALTHRAGLGFLAGALRRFLDAHPGAELYCAANHRLPPPLRDHPALRRVGPTAWPAYRRALPTMARRIAVYPLPDTPFARARSRSKLIEHAVMGAAPLYSAHWPRGPGAAAEGAGLALEADPEAWAAALAALAASPARARALAAGATALARRLEDPARQRALWTRLLGTAIS
jgi:hypothetical protein